MQSHLCLNRWKLTQTSLSRGVFDCQVVDSRPGYVQLFISGKNVKEIFKNESGGHRWQRIPPNEKRGRVHTSTVTVAILDSDETNFSLDYRDVEITTARGSGPGGQNRNKTESCVIATHKPTGLQVRIDNERSQHQNKATAYKILAAKLSEQELERSRKEKEKDRKDQVGSGMRGDKIRTYRTQEDQVKDHRTGNSWRLSDWLRGTW